VQGIFGEVVSPGNNFDFTASKLLEFEASGKLAAEKITMDKLTRKAAAIVTPGKKKSTKEGDPVEIASKHPRDEEGDEPQKKEPRTDESVCLRNIILQFFGNDIDSLGDLCFEGCIFKHIPVSNLKRSSFEKALQAGPALFGETFVADGWAEKLSEAYGSSGGLRKRAVCSLYGVPF